MRKFLLLVALTFAVSAFSQSMKMVVDSMGNVVGRYVRTNATTYTVGVQDVFDVLKSGKRVVTFKARNGQGVIWCKHLGRVNVYDRPSEHGTVIDSLVYEDGYVPETYPCLGKKRGWYKVQINDRQGYVRANKVQWDGMDTF